MAASDESKKLVALERRLATLEEEFTTQRTSKLAAEDEGTKILQAADNLELHGEDRCRRRKLIRRVALLLDPPEAASAALCLASSATPSSVGIDPAAIVDDLFCGAAKLLAELEWLSRLTKQAIAVDEATELAAFANLCYALCLTLLDMLVLFC